MNNFLKIELFLLKRKIADSDLTRILYSYGLYLLSRFFVLFSTRRAISLSTASARAFKNTLAENFVISASKRKYFSQLPKRPPVTKGDFGARCFLLKERISKDEKGVVLLKFNSTIRDFPIFVDMKKFLADYYLVLEPSWTGFVDEDILQYTAYDEPIWVLSAYGDDYRFLEKLSMNLVPVPLGPCDWVDPKISEQFLGSAKEFDIVFNSNWAPWKRHHILFSHISKLGSHIKVALIGVEWEGRSKKDILELAKHFGVLNKITAFERIPFEEVQKITSSSKVSILLSKKEGSNRALAEAMMCNIPVVILKNHIGGIYKNVVPETGIAVSESQLSVELKKILDGKYVFSPRKWALENASCHSSTEVLNRAIKEKCSVWTRDLYARANSPEPTYVGLSPDLNGTVFVIEDYFL